MLHVSIWRALFRWTKDFFVEEYDRVFRHSDWNIGIVHEPIHVFLESGARPDVRWFAPPKVGKYLADPFGIVRDGKVYILCVEFD